MGDTRLYWLDLETTGLDPERHEILEVAMYAATLSRPFDAKSLGSWCFYFPRGEAGVLDPFIQEMHTKNGLLDECDVGWGILTVEDVLLNATAVHKDEPKPILAGSSVHFDLAFLKRHMPRLAARFSHRLYDVSAVKLFCQSLGMPPLPKAEAHRAAADIQESIEHAKACARWLGDWSPFEGG